MSALRLAAFAAAALIASGVQQAPARAQTLNCDYGPIQRDYGGQFWKVFGCDDEASVIIVAAAGNRGAPYVFTLSPSAADSNVYELTGKGAGDPTYVEKARAEIAGLRAGQVRDLFKAARAKGNGD